MSFIQRTKRLSSTGSSGKDVPENKTLQPLLDAINIEEGDAKQIKRKSFGPKHSPHRVLPFECPKKTLTVKQLIPGKASCTCNYVMKKFKRTIPLRDHISHKKYCALLAKPRIIPQETPTTNRNVRNFVMCPARIEQLARPRKLLVLNTLRDYQDVLHPHLIEILENRLLNDLTIEPDLARKHFKCVKNKERMRKKALKKKRAKMLEQKIKASEKWRRCQECITSFKIVEHFKKKPLFTLTYRQMCISNELLSILHEKGLICKPKRKTRSKYKRRVIEIADQVSMWIDSFTRFLDMDYTESIDSMQKESESEMEGEESEVTDEEETETYTVTEEESTVSTRSGSERSSELSGLSMEGESAMGESLEGSSAFSDETGAQRGKKGIDEDLLAILISILEKMDSESLQMPIDAQIFSDVSYNMVLDGLREMQKGYEPGMSQDVEFFNKLLTDWARTYDEERVDGKMLDVIYEAAYYLAKLFARSLERDMVKDEYEVLHAPKPSAEEMSSSATEDVDGLETVKEEPSKEGTTTEGGRYLQPEDGDITSSGLEAGPKKPKTDLSATDDAGETLSAISEIEEDISALDTRPLHGSPAENEELIDLMGGIVQGASEEVTSGAMQGTSGITSSEGEGEGESEYGPGEDQAGVGVTKPETGPADEEGYCLSMKLYCLLLVEVCHTAKIWNSWVETVLNVMKNVNAQLQDNKKISNESWKSFADMMDRMLVSCRQYFMHSRKLTDKLYENLQKRKDFSCANCMECISDLANLHNFNQDLEDGLRTLIVMDALKEQKPPSGKDGKISELGTDKSRPSCSCKSEQATLPYEVSSASDSSSLSEDSLYEIEEIDMHDPRRPPKGFQ